MTLALASSGNLDCNNSNSKSIQANSLEISVEHYLQKPPLTS